MNSFIVILGLSCLAAVAVANPAQDLVVEFLNNGRIRCSRGHHQTAITCPPRVPSANCGAPNCNVVANRAWHHPHPDPNFFYQCAPWQGEDDWRAIAMPCACGTLFVTERNCCQHPHDWAPQCPNHVVPPTMAPCEEDCGPNCGVPPVTNPPPTTQAPPTPGTEDGIDTPGTPSPPNGNCPCVCIPCIFWPCQPCTASRTGCPCNNQNQNQQQRPQPLPQPLPQPPRDNPWARPEQPRQPPTQWIPEAPLQPEWQPPRLPQQPPRIPQQPPSQWQPQPPNQWQPQPPQQWVPQPPQNNPWQRPFGAKDEEEKIAEDEAL